MKTTLAVFGHYDSRGGTTGIPLPDQPTERDVRVAIAEYNKAFGWEEEVAMYQANPDSWSWNPTEPMSSPGENDFMFVAELHSEGPLPEGDLDEDNRKVVIDLESEPNGTVHTALELGCLISNTLEWPTQLEFVEMPEGYDADIKAHEKLVGEMRNTIGGYSFSSSWTEDQKRMSAGLTEIEEALDGIRNRRIIAACKFINQEKAQVRNWNDDAFGFLIGTGL